MLSLVLSFAPKERTFPVASFRKEGRAWPCKKGDWGSPPALLVDEDFKVFDGAGGAGLCSGEIFQSRDGLLGT